jgi:hypothetical protein
MIRAINSDLASTSNNNPLATWRGLKEVGIVAPYILMPSDYNGQPMKKESEVLYG